MLPINLGERIQVDLFGMRLPGGIDGDAAEATVVGLGPGVITVRLDRLGGAPEVTVGPGRVCRAWR
jgi:hypothetical protein